MLLYPHGDTQATAGWVSMYLRCEGNLKGGVESTFKFDFLDEQEQPIAVTTRSMDFNHTFKKADKGWGSSKIVRKDRIQNFLRDGTLHIKVTMNIHSVVTYAQAAPQEVMNCIPDDHTMGEDMEKLLHDPTCPTDVDFVIEREGCEREIISAHKMVLSVRSPVFRAMFKAGMQEESKREILLCDTSAEVFRALVRYIYTGQCNGPLLFSHTEECLYLADKYDLKGLRQQCEKELAAGLSADNTLALLSLSTTYDMPTLREVAWAALSRNFKFIKSTSEFKELAATDPTLFDDILEHIYNTHHNTHANTDANNAQTSSSNITANNTSAGRPQKKMSFVRKHFGKKVPAHAQAPAPPALALPAAPLQAP